MTDRYQSQFSVEIRITGSLDHPVLKELMQFSVSACPLIAEMVPQVASSNYVPGIILPFKTPYLQKQICAFTELLVQE